MSLCDLCGREPCECSGKSDSGLLESLLGPIDPRKMADSILKSTLGVTMSEIGVDFKKTMATPRCNRCGHGGVCLVTAPDASRNGKGHWMSQAYCAGCGLYGDASDNAFDAIRSLRRFQGCKLPE